MAQWRKTGDVYVSKNGNDNTGDGSATNPFASIQKGVDALSTGQKLIVGTGKYEEAVSNGHPTNEIIGDGLVIWDGNSLVGQITGIDKGIIRNLRIKNFYLVQASFQDCFIDNITSTILQGTVKGNILKSCTFAQNTNVGTQFRNCTFISCAWTGKWRAQSVQNCHFDENTAPEHDLNYLLSSDFNNYEMDKVNNMSLSDFQLANPNLEQNSITENPIFGDDTIDNYTLQNDSVNLGAGIDGDDIGAWGRADSFDGLSDQFLPANGAILTDVDVDGNGNFTITAPSTTGIIESAGIDLGKKYTLDIFDFFGDYDLDAGEVPDLDNVAQDPNHLTYQMKYADTEGDLETATWYQMVWGYPPQIGQDSQSNTVGNGDPDFDISTATPVEAQWVKILITLRNDGIGG